MIVVGHLCKDYALATGLRALSGSSGKVVRAVRDVNFSIASGEVLGLVGESGSGKTTVGKMLVGLEEPTEGDIVIEGESAARLRKERRKEFHRRVQMVFQDPYGSLNPQHTVGEIVSRPLQYQGVKDREAIAAKVEAVLDEVGLSPVASFIGKFPHHLSGGQRQRVCIARAIVLEPTFLVADEPISMLDVSIKAGIIRLLKRLARERDIALLYITHDLATVSNICDRIAVMYAGRIVEVGPVRTVLNDPRHPYTQALIDALPSPDPDVRRPAPSIRDVPFRAGVDSKGCSFAPRCMRATPTCAEQAPVEEVADWRAFSCHFPLAPTRAIDPELGR